MNISIRLDDNLIRGKCPASISNIIRNALCDGVTNEFSDGDNCSITIEKDIVGIVHNIDLVLKAKAISINNNTCTCYSDKFPNGNPQRIFYFYAKPEQECYPGSIVDLHVTNPRYDTMGICVAKNPKVPYAAVCKSIRSVKDNKDLPFMVPPKDQDLFKVLFSNVKNGVLSAAELDCLIAKCFD